MDDAGQDIALQNVSDANSSKRQNSMPTLQPENRTKGILNSSLEKFLELQKRREDLSQLSHFKLAKLDEKQAANLAKKKWKELPPLKTKLTTQTCKPIEKDWEDVRQYFDVNAHLTGPVGHGIREPKSGLEETINAEITEGNFDKAIELSDALAERELGVRINEAFGAKRYAEAEEVKKETMLRKRQKRIPWGFETKERWEMKGNM